MSRRDGRSRDVNINDLISIVLQVICDLLCTGVDVDHHQIGDSQGGHQQDHHNELELGGQVRPDPGQYEKGGNGDGGD